MARRNKYNAKKTIVDGIEFDSIREAERYRELKLLERGKEIRNLVLQPRFLFKITYHTQPKRTYGKSGISDKFEIGKRYYVSNHCGERNNSTYRIDGNATLIKKTDRIAIFDFKKYKSTFLWNCYGIDWKVKGIR